MAWTQLRKLDYIALILSGYRLFSLLFDKLVQHQVERRKYGMSRRTFRTSDAILLKNCDGNVLHIFINFSKNVEC